MNEILNLFVWQLFLYGNHPCWINKNAQLPTLNTKNEYFGWPHTLGWRGEMCTPNICWCPAYTIFSLRTQKRWHLTITVAWMASLRIIAMNRSRCYHHSDIYHELKFFSRTFINHQPPLEHTILLPISDSGSLQTLDQPVNQNGQYSAA